MNTVRNGKVLLRLLAISELLLGGGCLWFSYKQLVEQGYIKAFLLIAFAFFWIAMSIIIFINSRIVVIANDERICYMKNNRIIRELFWSDYHYAYFELISNGVISITLSPINLSDEDISIMSKEFEQKNGIQRLLLASTIKKDLEILHFIEKKYNTDCQLI